MTFDKQSNVRRTVVESKSNRSCNHPITVVPIQWANLWSVPLRPKFWSQSVKAVRVNLSNRHAYAHTHIRLKTLPVPTTFCSLAGN